MAKIVSVHLNAWLLTFFSLCSYDKKNWNWKWKKKGVYLVKIWGLIKKIKMYAFLIYFHVQPTPPTVHACMPAFMYAHWVIIIFDIFKFEMSQILTGGNNFKFQILPFLLPLFPASSFSLKMEDYHTFLHFLIFLCLWEQ